MKNYYVAYDERYKKIHTEEKVSWADENPSKIILDLLLKYGANNSSKILEIGCGEGQNAIYLMKNGLNITATDVSPEAINWCKNRARESKVDINNFFVLDALDNNLALKYDYIYAISTLHMLVKDEDRHNFLTFISSHLKDNGKAIISIMGDGIQEKNNSDINKSINLSERKFNGKFVQVATTSCRIVNWENFQQELINGKLSIIEKFNTAEISGFNNSMVVVCEKLNRFN